MLSLTGAIGVCTCHSRRALKRRDFFLGPAGVSLETTAREHLPGCPASRMADPDRKQKISFRYIGFSRRAFDAAIQLSFAITSGAGSWSLSPSLTYRPTVDRTTAPAFRALDLLRDLMGAVFDEMWLHDGSSCLLLPQWEKLVALALAKILRAFNAGRASPLAVDWNNQSLTHAVTSCVGTYRQWPQSRKLMSSESCHLHQ